ncbi:hypothetical protein DPM35_26845 [Mesorhizobium atlanticum]|uniref:Uncharacterized protein n=1 Tax=Mesorhizobium atlanticum TaxID=2233532 RepID=A0A330GNJ5_9HYPH|nr:hypothetical protein DPM35_26845 [Mesorhizobium atlanticum]
MDRCRVIYFQATRVSSVLNLEQFKLEVARVLGPSPALASLDSWEGIFGQESQPYERRPEPRWAHVPIALRS